MVNRDSAICRLYEPKQRDLESEYYRGDAVRLRRWILVEGLRFSDPRRMRSTSCYAPLWIRYPFPTSEPKIKQSLLIVLM